MKKCLLTSKLSDVLLLLIAVLLIISSALILFFTLKVSLNICELLIEGYSPNISISIQ